MKVIVEAHIPYIKGLLEEFAETVYLPAAAITAETVKDADALFVRTRTRCDRALLDGSSVKFIATATIGTDHIDTGYCQSAGIDVCNAPGCNAPAVAQYVFATIGQYMNGSPVKGMTLGVVGVGHVGSIVARWGERLGMRVLRCDPPRQRAEGGGFVTLDTIAEEAEFITFHTPLTTHCPDATFHLADAGFFAKAKACRLLINSARGGIVDEQALLESLNRGGIADAAIDCWEKEPDIDRRLLGRLFVATPHIAGYSKEGKSRATTMALEGFERHFNVAVSGKPAVEAPAKGADINSIGEVTASYNPLEDTARLLADPTAFETLRNSYNLRDEVR